MYSIGDEGVLFAHGDQGGGYSLHVENGHLWLAYNGYGAMVEVDCGSMPVGDCEISFDLTALAGSRANVAVGVNDVPAARVDDLPLLMAMAPFQGIDVGIDRRSPVSWERYERHGSFPYQGQLHQVRWEPGEASPEDPTKFADLLRDMYQKYD